MEKELREEGHENLLAVPTDIASESSVTEAYQQIDSELPPVVGLVNLAGIACPVPLHECSLDEFERVMAVNVTGSFLMLKAAAARMIPQGVGRIVNTSSITAFDGGGTFSKGVYATAKAAVIGMCKGGARELGPYGITVNVIAPGPVDTEIMGGRLTDERKASMSAGIPLAASDSRRRSPPRCVPAVGGRRLHQRSDHSGRRRQVHALNSDQRHHEQGDIDGRHRHF